MSVIFLRGVAVLETPFFILFFSYYFFLVCTLSLAVLKLMRYDASTCHRVVVVVSLSLLSVCGSRQATILV